jgi:signal transduction histidine kinase/ligand-binding sensor domain-containing protein/CheY-like chemotaxis protein
MGKISLQNSGPARGLVVGAMASVAFLYFFSGSLLSRDSSNVDHFRRYYSVNDGLSQNEVTAIIQDKHGFMWFGTRGGLNRFDGYEFLKFKPEPGVSRGLKSPSVETLYPDREGNIWIGTKSGGVGLYEVSRAGFADPGPEAGFPNRIVSFFQDDRGHYWIGSWDNGVFEFDPERGIIQHFLAGLRVSSILQTADGSMWFGTSSGLRFRKHGENEVRRYNFGAGYNEVTGIVESPVDSTIWLVGWSIGMTRIRYSDFTHETYMLNGMDSRSLNTYSLLDDGHGNLWVGTWGNGLYRFSTSDFSSHRINIYPPGILKPLMDYDIVLDLYRDRSGDIWVGTDGGGIVRVSMERNFRTLLRDQTGNVGAWHVNAVHFSDDNELWIGTRAAGLFVTNNMKDFEFIPVEEGDPLAGKTGYLVKRLNDGPEGYLWVSLDNGLYVVRRTGAGRRVLSPAAKALNSDDLRLVRKALDVKQYRGDLWVATQQNGLYRYTKKGEGYELSTRYHSGDQYASFEDNRISALLVDHQQNLWIGTYKGLYRMGPADTIPVPVSHLVEQSGEFLCDIILSLAADRSNSIWTGTPCSLNALTETPAGTYSFREFTRRDGLTDDYINAIELSDGYTWVSTNAGVSRIEQKSGEIRNYDVSDGVYGYNFSEGSGCQTPDGTIYFGGSSDITWFNPGEFSDDRTTPAIAITSFKVMNREVPVTSDGILPAEINEVERIVLGHRQREFSFEIASLDYRSPENNQYAYKLVGSKGEGDEWVYTGQRRHISFSNLRSGEYTLILAGTSSNGIWNREGRRISIKILPPPWRTWYALFIYIVVILLIVVLINRFSLQKERLKSIAELEHLSRLKEKELNEFKLRFFTDITHELKTPLSLIQAPVEELMGRGFSTLSEAFFMKRMRLIHSSAVRLIDLLNQLLEFRKVEVGKAVLKAAEQDIAKYVSVICEPYNFLAESKKILFRTGIPSREIPLWFESSKMDVIVNNLLSNAFKYSGTPGKVWLQLEESEHEVTLVVSNDGEGISKGELQNLFDRFYQASGGSRKRGSGIGLDLVKRFVVMHKGLITVESEPGGHTTFTVRFLKGKEHLSEAERPGDVKEVGQTEVVNNIPAAEEPVSPGHFPRGTRGARILVVDDDEHVRDYLADLLGESFEIVFARDGTEGFERALEEMPDLVVSDVMMPRSDGYELCARLKKSDRTSHVPVILLTAKGGKEEQLAGTRYGADAYFTKPFDPSLLLERIKQLIAGRVLLKDKFSRRLTLEPLNLSFSNPGGDRLTDYIPLNESLVKDRGIDIPLLPGDKNGLNDGPPVMHDILGNPLTGKPDMGAIELGVKVKIQEK